MSRVQHGSIIIRLTLCHRCLHHAVVGAIHSRDLSLAYFSIRSWRSRTVACPSGREWEFPLRSDIQLCRSINFDERKNACFLSRRFRLYILPDRRNLNCSTFLKIFSKKFEKEKSPEKMNSQGTVFYFVLFIALHISSNFLRIFLSFLTIALCVL